MKITALIFVSASIALIGCNDEECQSALDSAQFRISQLQATEKILKAQLAKRTSNRVEDSTPSESLHGLLSDQSTRAGGLLLALNLSASLPPTAYTAEVQENLSVIKTMVGLYDAGNRDIDREFDKVMQDPALDPVRREMMHSQRKRLLESTKEIQELAAKLPSDL